MLLVVDAGNTNVVFAIHDKDGWRGSWRIRTDAQRTSDEYAVWLLTLIGHVGLKREDIDSVKHDFAGNNSSRRLRYQAND